jgi:hypothetical protein
MKLTFFLLQFIIICTYKNYSKHITLNILFHGPIEGRQQQNLAYLLQLPTGLPKISILVAKKKILGAPTTKLSIFAAVASWASV